MKSKVILNVDYVMESTLQYNQLVRSTEDAFENGNILLDLDGEKITCNIIEILDIDWHGDSPECYYTGSLLAVVEIEDSMDVDEILELLSDYRFQEIQGTITFHTKDGVHSGQVPIITGVQDNEKSH